MTDTDREAVERFISMYCSGHQGCHMDCDDAQIFSTTLLALRTALDEAEAEAQAMVAAALTEAAESIQISMDTARRKTRDCDMDMNDRGSMIWSAIASHLQIEQDCILALITPDARDALDRAIAAAMAEVG